MSDGRFYFRAMMSTALETYSIRDSINVIERFFNVPLDYADPTGPTIRIFARNFVPKDKEKKDGLPYFVYLTGGPGFECSDGLKLDGLAAQAHEKGYQTLFLDQRGTGLSTPISHETLPEHLHSDKEKADYLKFFRADSIVKDCETIRQSLLGHKPNPSDQKWTILGQSFGGFCAITYLSFYPHGLKEVFLTGGLAPLVDHPDPVYEVTIHKVIQRNRIFYDKYPQDIKRVRDIVTYLSVNDVKTPNGGRLSVSRWQLLGLGFGATGGIDRIHQLVFRASDELQTFNKLSHKTLEMIERASPFDGNPLYAILQEPLYCQRRASRWAAERALKNYSQLFDWFHVKTLADTEPIYFIGEMILSSFFEDFAGLRPFKGAAHLLAQDDKWGQLYDLEQLAKNEVRVNAATYYDDMYVDFGLSQDTASKIKNTEQYITNQLFHDGIRVDAKHVMQRLFRLSKREYN